MAALSVDGFILVDTNILIYHLKGLLETPLKAQLAQALAVGSGAHQRHHTHGDARLARAY